MVLDFGTIAVEVHSVWHDIWVATEWGRRTEEGSFLTRRSYASSTAY
jgi:hypothetical protein